MLDTFSFGVLLAKHLRGVNAVLRGVVAKYVSLRVGFEKKPTFFAKYVWFSIDLKEITYIMLVE